MSLMAVYRPKQHIQFIPDQDELNELLRSGDIESLLIEPDELAAYLSVFYVSNPVDLIGFDKQSLIDAKNSKVESSIKEDDSNDAEQAKEVSERKKRVTHS